MDAMIEPRKTLDDLDFDAVRNYMRRATEQVLVSAVGPGLEVAARKNGQPLNAAIVVSQNGQVVARSSTREFNPISFHLPPGEYELEAMDGAARQKPRLRANVSLGGQGVEHTFDFSEAVDPATVGALSLPPRAAVQSDFAVVGTAWALPPLRWKS